MINATKIGQHHGGLTSIERQLTRFLFWLKFQITAAAKFKDEKSAEIISTTGRQ